MSLNPEPLNSSRWIRWELLLPVVIFFAGFGLYLFSSAPALAPYRDMGEMVSVSKTLGVAHPPGYPAYTMIGKLSTLIPMANISYRVNLASVIGGALSGALLYLFLTTIGISMGAAAFAAFAWLSAAGVWTVSIVTEMYSLHLAAGMLLLFVSVLCLSDKIGFSVVYLTAFLGALFLGVRLDLVLLMPALLFLFFSVYRERKEITWKRFAVAVCFFALGFSVYLYLMIRSNQNPLLNWNRPQTLAKLWGSLTRKTHGGTLDLLSANYAPGSLFITDMKFYLNDFSRQTSGVGVILALLGFFILLKENRRIWFFTLLGWLFAGPFFLYKANLPPNTHALAILEPHFLLPNIFLFVWAAAGLNFLMKKIGTRKEVLAVSLIVGLAVSGINASLGWRSAGKRNNFYGIDYAKHVFRTVPQNSIVIMQKDVQLFSLWALQYAENFRKDVTIVARGLAGSSWYIQNRKEEGVNVILGPLKSESDFARFLQENRDRETYAGWEEDVPYSPRYQQLPRGLLRKLVLVPDQKTGNVLAEPQAASFLNELYAYRGNYRYHLQKEFFSSDLIEDYSKSHFGLAVEHFKESSLSEKARKEWTHALALNSENGACYYRRAFTYFQPQTYELALRDFLWAERLYGETFRLTQEYLSLPDVVDSIRSEWAETLLNIGVAFERLGRRQESESAYLKALSVRPNLAAAHYNLAVLDWNRNWKNVVMHLQEALRIDPNNPQARAFLPKALYALQNTSQKTP